MYQAGRLFSVLVLVLSVAVHTATFLPFVLITMAQVWPLHLGAMLAFFAAAFTKSRMDKKAAPAIPFRFSANPLHWYDELRTRYALQWQSISRIPLALRVILLVVMAYTAYNFSLFIQRSENGLPEKVGSSYVVKNKGRIVRPSNEAEYRQGQKWLVRGFSGHWILFSLLPVLFFTYLSPEKVDFDAVE